MDRSLTPTMKCPSCGAAVNTVASHCPACGVPVRMVPAGGGADDGETRIAGPLGTAPPELRADDTTRLGVDAPMAGVPDAGETRLAGSLGAAASEFPADDLTRLGSNGPAAGVPDTGETRLATTVDPPTAGRRTGSPVNVATRGVSGTGRAATANGLLEPGQAFGSRYHIIRELGVGGMGAVYQAWDAELGVAVAIKIIRAGVLADPEAAAELERRFKRELLLARQVTHKNVVRIHDLGEIDGINYITMTYVEGGDLASLLKREGRLPVPAVMRIARDVVAGLVEAHKAGVVHRDLKPANIMIDKEGDALIMDFGIARSSGAPAAARADTSIPEALRRTAANSGATRVGAVVGTVEYLAPEQARGQAVDQRADIYALGLMLYDMLVGREHRAQHTNSAIAELQSRMEQAPPPAKTAVPDIPDALDQLISRCLQPDPALRYQTTEELAADLNRLDDNGVPIPGLRRFTPRMIAAGALLIVLLVAGTWWLTRTPPPEPAHDPVSVVIADFNNGTGDPAFDQALVQIAKRALEGASFISAYDRGRMVSLGLPARGKLDAAAARDMALKQGFGVVLAGSIVPRNGGYQIDATALQTVTGQPITTASRYATTKNDVPDAAAKLMAAVRQALGDKTSESAQLFAMRSVTAGSVDAVGYYAKAVEAQAQGNVEETRQNYLKAVQVDPKFGLAYQGLAATSRNLGRNDDALNYIKEALRYLDSMTDRERLATRGLYDRIIGDNAQCAKEYGDLLARYPADATAHNQRAGCLKQMRNMRGATEELRQAVKMLPNHVGMKTNLALLMVLSGDFDGTERLLKTFPQMSPFAVQFLAYSQVGRGQLAQAAESYRKLAQMGPAAASTAASGLADLAIYEGRFSDAVGILEKGAADDVASKTPDKAAIKWTSIGYAHLMAGRTQPAVAAAEKALSLSKSMAVQFLAARILVEGNALEPARAIATSLSSQLPAEPHAHGRIIEGLIALKTGKVREAVEILGDANNTLDTWFGRFDLGRAFLAAGALPQADSEFDRCIARRGEALSLMDEGPTYGYFPIVFYYQGKVREGLNTASFADLYRRYLDIRGASTDDPLVAEVRKRVNR